MVFLKFSAEAVRPSLFLLGVVLVRILAGILVLVAVLAGRAEAAFRFEAPEPSTEFESMAYAPVYLTFSWEPVAGVRFYQVQVVDSSGAVVRELRNGESLSRVTDWEPYVELGEYYWQVRIIDADKNPMSDWSARRNFSVTAPVEVAALGDSITHGGANFIPASQLSCQWETFCDVPIKNIGRSGDTTAAMIERFERDVLPFRPKVLVIMGGVNDIREGAAAAEVIDNLKILREKCLDNGIIPVFATLTPMNEKIIRGRAINLTDRDWRLEREKINRWIINNGGVEISAGLADETGDLRADFTPDGLHPNLRGKKIIGEAISKFLEAKDFVRTDG